MDRGLSLFSAFFRGLGCFVNNRWAARCRQITEEYLSQSSSSLIGDIHLNREEKFSEGSRAPELCMDPIF
jgi:metallophosphoesterase superfamily enzyme